MWLRARGLSWWRCVSCVLGVMLVVPDAYIVLSVPFYSSKGRPRLQGVGIRISLDRGIARWPTRGLRTGVASSHLVSWYFGDDGAWASEFSSCTSSWIGFGMITLVRHGSCHIRGGWSDDFHRLTLSWEGMYLLEGRATRAALLSGALTLGVSRGAAMGYYACFVWIGRSGSHLHRYRGELWWLRRNWGASVLPIHPLLVHNPQRCLVGTPMWRNPTKGAYAYGHWATC